MNRALKLCWQGIRWCGACVLSFGVWTLWLALGLLFAVQIYVASTNRLEVPPFLLRALETRLAASGVSVAFGRTTFDPTGRILIEQARVSLPAYAEPVATVRAIYVRLDPWALAAGKFEPREIRVIGASCDVPAMLSPSGRAEDVLRDLDATLVPGENTVAIEQLVGRAAGVVISAHGAVHLPSGGPARGAPLPIADFLAHNYPALCRQISAVADRLATLESPALHLELSPSESRGAIANVTLLAQHYQLAAPVPLQATNLRIVTRFPLLGDAPVAARLELTAAELQLPFGAVAQHVRAAVRGTLYPTQLRYEPRDFQLTAESVAAAGFTAGPVAAQLTPGPLPRIDADIVALLFGEPLAVQAETDFKEHTARLRFAGAVSPKIYGPLNARLGVDVRQWFNFEALDCRSGAAQFGPDWKFQDLTASVAVRGIDAYHVRMDEGHAEVEFDGHHLHSPAAYARIGENFARGTYDHDLKTRDYRFLLEGRLRPLDISGWFQSGWWANFFQQFEHPTAPPTASVDVQGRWGDGRQSAVFIYVDTKELVIRGAKLDHARALLFVRPGYFDGLDVSATRERGVARGTFTYTIDRATSAWQRFDLDATSTIDPAIAVQIIGPAGAAVLAPFHFAATPALKLAGRLTGPGAPEGVHQSVRIEGRSDAEFRFHDFALERIAFKATLKDDDLTLDPVETGFAGGVVTGRAHVWGQDRERRVGFDFALKEASLGRAIVAMQEFSARQRGAPPAPPGKFVTGRANVHFDLAATAEGRFGDPYSYHGTGSALLQGTEIGEVRMLGLLSDLLKFTALRFNTAQAAFKIDGSKLVFPDVKLRGANSAIDGRGDYALDKRELDFTANIYPLHESGNLLKKGLELVLSPLTSVFEVKLTGTLDDPKWGLVLGPTNLLRSLGPSGSTPADEKSPPPPAETAPKSDSPPPVPPPKP